MSNIMVFLVSLFVGSVLCRDTICDFIAATNIASISSKTMWACSVLGVASTNPCTTSWSGLICSSNNLLSISVGGIGLKGIYFCNYIMFLRYNYCPVLRHNPIYYWKLYQFDIS